MKKTRIESSDSKDVGSRAQNGKEEFLLYCGIRGLVIALLETCAQRSNHDSSIKFRSKRYITPKLGACVDTIF